MDYQKYLKYKTKYLQLKAKSLQLGGAFIWTTQVSPPITQNESEYIQQQYLKGNTTEFTIPASHSSERYRYRLNIGNRTGVRIGRHNENPIKQEDTTPPSSQQSSKPPGGHVVSREYYREEQRREPSDMRRESSAKPQLSFDLNQAKQIIRKYVQKFLSKNLVVSEAEYIEIKGARDAIDASKLNEPRYEHDVRMLFEFAQAIYRKDEYDIKFLESVLTSLNGK